MEMKQVDHKDLPNVPGGYTLPTEPGLIGPCFPDFPVPDPNETVVPMPETFNTKL